MMAETELNFSADMAAAHFLKLIGTFLGFPKEYINIYLLYK